MEKRQAAGVQSAKFLSFTRSTAPSLPDAVYRDLVSTLFTMTMPILGFGVLYALLGVLIYINGQDWTIGAMVGCAIIVTLARVNLIRRYHRAGGSSQAIPCLKRWELHYASLTYAFALLLAALNIRSLMAHEPLIQLASVSLIFTFGAGIVSRNAGRPRLCTISLLLAVAPVVVVMLARAANAEGKQIHAEFLALEALILFMVGLMSLGSVRHLYASMVEHLTMKHDLAKLARFDALTGLPNRLLLREAFQTGLKCVHGANWLAIHYLDLDGFKSINDQFGHPTGDKLLGEVARRLSSTVRSDDVVARLGGDEFLIVQANVQHVDQAELLGRRVLRRLSDPYVIDDKEMRVSVSVGIALAPEHGVDLEELMTCADMALYRSKATGKAQVQFYAPDEREGSGRSVA